jgi:hypothetical protein
MFKTIFIIFVSMIASALTTAGLLYRYTAPVASPSASVAQANPVGISDDFIARQTSSIGEESDAVMPVVNYESIVDQAPAANQQREVVNVEVVTPQQQRSFNHQLLVSDISSLSRKLESFNDFLSNEVQRLKDGKTKKQP